jgi:beta-glucosidase
MPFPKDFTWGVATSSYQIEGAWKEAGKGLSIWDVFCQIPGNIKNNENGNVACDHYHRYKEDIQLMKAMGVKAYRFSISWPRILPDGKGEINQEGIDFYNRIIDELIRQNIEPWITLYHWDLPQTLQVEDNGWLGKSITDHFAEYARVCFKAFGDRVVNWITINEAWVVSILGYGQGIFAPGGTSNSDPYLAGHHLLIAHAKAVAIYRSEFQTDQKGRIGMTNNCDWREPINNDPAHIAAAERALEFFLAWFTDPIYLGKYPDTMVERLGSRLPEFTKEEINLVHGSSDFLGLNHYTTMYAEDAADGLVVGSVYGNGGISEDQNVNLSVDAQWKMTNMGWAVVPWGCHRLLHWISNRYNHPEIVMTENGCAYEDVCIDGKVDDRERIEYYRSYLEACNQAIDEGVHLSAYFAWSFMDNFEWASGYSKRFGLHYVDFDTLERTPKSSAKWFAKMIKKHNEKLLL